MNKTGIIRMVGKFVVISAIIFTPLFFAFAYDLCPKNIAPKLGKHVIVGASSDISKDTINFECITLGSSGDIVRMNHIYSQAEQNERVELAMAGKAIFSKIEEDEKIYISGKESPCSLFIGGENQEFYAKKCPDLSNKGKFYYDFNGQKSNSFTQTSHDEKISKDGKIFSATLWHENGNTVLMGARKKSVLPNSIFDKNYTEYVSVRRVQSGPKRIDTVYYNGIEIAKYEDYDQVYAKGVVLGKGPIYVTERYLPSGSGKENEVYIGKQLLYKGGCSIDKVAFSPDERHYAVKISDNTIFCKSKKNIIFDGKELPNTSEINSQDETLGFSDNGKLYYVSKENGKYFFNFNGKKVGISTISVLRVRVKGDNFAISYGEQDNFSRGYAGLIYNGKKIFEKKTSNGLVVNVIGILPKGKGILYEVSKQYHNNNNNEGEGTYLNSTLLKDGCYYHFYTDNGDIACDRQVQKGGVVNGYVINGKVVAILGNGEGIISNHNLNFVIRKYLPNSDFRTGKASVQYSYNGKVFASLNNVMMGSRGEYLSDDGKYLAVFYFEGNNLIKEVFKVK